MTTNNLNIWDAVTTPDPQFTRAFQAEGFHGTAINPTYLVRAATAQFGPIGIGWGYEIVDDQFIESTVGQTVHILRLAFWYERDGKRGRFEHFGQTTFASAGSRSVDGDVKKKSLTDALVKCLSMLGFGADVYMGRFDDLKYLQSLTEATPPTVSPVVLAPASSAQPSTPDQPLAVKKPAAVDKSSWLRRIKTLSTDALEMASTQAAALFDGDDLKEVQQAISARTSEFLAKRSA
jgi:hypothetical protein